MPLRKIVRRKRVYRKKTMLRKKTVPKTVKAYKRAGNYVRQAFTVLDTAITAIPGAPFTYDYSPSLVNIQAAELAAYQELYDEYRIVKCILDIRPNTLIGDTNDSMRVYSVIDKNDSGSLPNVGTALAYNNCQIRTSSSKHCVYRSFVPSLTIRIADVNGTSFFQEQTPKFINIQNTNVAHLGAKVISDNNPSQQNLVFNSYITLLVEFRTKA